MLCYNLIVMLKLILAVQGKLLFGSFKDCGCWVNVFLRQPCNQGEFLDETTCLSLGCCYDATIHTLETYRRGFCYAKTGNCPADTKCHIVGPNRRVCGHQALDKPLCEMRGCCFDISQQPMCYYRNEKFSSFQQTSAALPSTLNPTSLATSPVTQPVVNPSQVSSTSPQPSDEVHLSVPFGYYYLDGLLVVFHCASQGLSCGKHIYDKKSCLKEQCCWNEETAFNRGNQCILPLVNVTRLSSPLKWGVWLEWSHWSDCEGDPCKTGKKVRIRKCGGSEKKLNGICFGVFWEEDTCYVSCTPRWSTWGTWTICPSSCGLALKKRSRKCLLEAFETDLNQCTGGKVNSIENQSCRNEYCRHWSVWVETSCSAYCGQGYRVKYRNCHDYSGVKQDSSECSKKVLPCHERICFPTYVSRHFIRSTSKKLLKIDKKASLIRVFYN